VNPDIIKQNLYKILDILDKENIKTLLAGMLSQETLGKEYKKSFDKIYPDLAKKFKVSFLPFLLKDVALKPEYNLEDGKHPNSKGIQLISENLERKLINFLIN
ncbi:hypothetical protein OA848_05495, partial [Rickettsiales bacterium]|nr:hypothetical protein [Rickettsiales bacterium]